jgi:pimeloyl-ACP methyl ester carboxylesterase
LAEFLGEKNSYFIWMAQNLLHHDPEFLRLLVEAPEILVNGYEMVELLPRIDCPVLLLHADQTMDGVLADQEASEALRLLPNGRQMTLNGVGHALHHTHPDEVLRVLTEFLDELAADTAGE